MNTMTFLGESKDAPRVLAEGKHQTLVRPNPGLDAYRVYFNHRIEEIAHEQDILQIPVADFVACLSSSEPTDSEWSDLLTSHGYTEEQVTTIRAE